MIKLHVDNFFKLFWLYWIFVAALCLSLVAGSEGYSLVVVHRPSHFSGFSYWVAQALGPMDFSSCGSWAELLCGMWNLPGRGIESVSPALAGEFLTTGPPGNSKDLFLFNILK